MAEQPQPRRLRYEDALQAVGRYAEKERLRDICLLEVEGGMVIQGRAIINTREGFDFVLRTKILSHDDLERLLERR